MFRPYARTRGSPCRREDCSEPRVAGHGTGSAPGDAGRRVQAQRQARVEVLPRQKIECPRVGERRTALQRADQSLPFFGVGPGQDQQSCRHIGRPEARPLARVRLRGRQRQLEYPAQHAERLVGTAGPGRGAREPHDGGRIAHGQEEERAVLAVGVLEPPVPEEHVAEHSARGRIPRIVLGNLGVGALRAVHVTLRGAQVAQQQEQGRRSEAQVPQAGRHAAKNPSVAW